MKRKILGVIADRLLHPNTVQAATIIRAIMPHTLPVSVGANAPMIAISAISIIYAATTKTIKPVLVHKNSFKLFFSSINYTPSTFGKIILPNTTLSYFKRLVNTNGDVCDIITEKGVAL